MLTLSEGIKCSEVKWLDAFGLQINTADENQ